MPNPRTAGILLTASLFVLMALMGTGCGKKTVDIPTEVHVPPPSRPAAEPAPKPKPKPPPGKIPATQRPYTIMGKQYVPLASADGFVQTGIASWYGQKFHGRKTANGETYDMYAMTAAHTTLPMNTWVDVENLDNGKKIRVRINDRGPFVAGRVIDLSHTGADRIGMLGPGTARVRVTALGEATSYTATRKDEPATFKPLDYWKGNFTLQVGAFAVRSNAEALREKLAASYVNAHITTYEDQRGTFFRVRVGKFSDLRDAERFTKQIMADEGFEHVFPVAE